MKNQIQYIVIPHPDDEFSAWSMVARSTDRYSVFILLTRGEQTSLYDGHGLQAQYGEIVPQPQPWAGKGSATLRAQRVFSWSGFLDDMSLLDNTLDSPTSAGVVSSPVGSFDLWIGSNTARAVFDLGDGTLTPERVTAAIQAVRGIRDRFGVDGEYGVVGAAYWNANYPGSVVYTHPDHRAVHQALWGTDQGTHGPQWARTAANDPDALSAGMTGVIDADLYNAAMGVDPLPIDPAGNPNARRTGAYQRWYGWLAFDAGSYWMAGETDAHTHLSRSQTFWRRFGTP